jgi:hypothetical protein
MQVNTLNRVIALFLIGGLAVVLAAVALKEEIEALSCQYPRFGAGPSSSVFLAVALLSITALSGTIVDAMGRLTVRRLIAGAAKGHFLTYLLVGRRGFKSQDRWRAAFESALFRDPRHRVLATQEEMIKPLAATIFFRTAGKEHAEWLIQHYSMYHLSTNFVVLLIVCAIWSLIEGCFASADSIALKGWLVLASVSIVVAYLLMTFALESYLYSYQLIFRNAYLTMSEAPLVVGEKQKDVCPAALQ